MENFIVQRRWSIEKRLEFIDFELFWSGQINRSDIKKKFGISAQQASTDLSLYAELAPKNLKYDLSEKKYFASTEFMPVFFKPQADIFLQQLRDDILGIREERNGDEVLSHDNVILPKRNVDPYTLRTMSNAIRSKKTIEIFYQSMSSEDPSWRSISPHSFAFDGMRWHVRAFCHKGEDYRDFLLSRILKVGTIKDVYVSKDQDAAWNEFFTVVLKPHPKLSNAQANAVALDYGMSGMKLEVRVRIALLYYFLRRLELQDCDGENRKPREQHVVVDNKNETRVALSKA